MTRSVEERDLICSLWVEGKSAKEIAVQVGNSLSRNAVIGIVFRAGLQRGTRESGGPQRYVKVKAPKAPNPNARPRRKFIVVGDTVFSAGEQRLPRAVAKDAAFLPLLGSKPRHLTERPAGACCWPVGDEFLSCCEPTQNHKYCPEHRALSVSPAQPRHPNSPPMMRQYARVAT